MSNDEKDKQSRFGDVPTKKQTEAFYDVVGPIISNAGDRERLAAEAAISAIFAIHNGCTLGDLARAIAEACGADPDETVALIDERLENIPV